MFRITEDPSSGCLVQCLAKITGMILSCTLNVHVNVHDRIILVIFSQALYKAT